MKSLPPDFRDLLVEFHDGGVDFVVVGGYAVGFHGWLRATKDIDILVRPTAENAQRTYAALARFGAPIQAFEISPADFSTYDGFFTMGVAPQRVDVLNSITGVGFDEAIADGEHFEIDGRRILVIGRAALLKNKRAAGRPADQRDIEMLTLEPERDG